jgi:hypothetical protein
MVSIILLALLSAQETAADPARKAVERALPYLEAKGLDWIKERKCASCHHVTFMVWAHREALDRGFAVDPKKLEEWTRWQVDFSVGSKTKEGRRNGGGLDTMAQVILSRPPGADEAPYRELAGLIAGEQKPEGYWEAGGQLPSQRRPKEETRDASTMWVLHSLPSLLPDESREKAKAWLKDRKPGKSTESLALHFLTTRSDELLKELLAAQNGDGGWGWLRGEESDPLATGQTLYVLGTAKAAEPVRRAREFLARTQLEDGSWKVRSTHPTTKNPSIAAYWGSAWATIGMLRTLP